MDGTRGHIWTETQEELEQKLRDKGWVTVLDWGAERYEVPAEWCLPRLNPYNWYPLETASDIQRLIEREGLEYTYSVYCGA